MVQRIVILDSKLHGRTLLDREILEQRKIEVIDAVGANPAETRAEADDNAGKLLGRVAVEPSIDVEPAFGLSLTDRKLLITWQPRCATC